MGGYYKNRIGRLSGSWGIEKNPGHMETRTVKLETRGILSLFICQGLHNFLLKIGFRQTVWYSLFLVSSLNKKIDSQLDVWNTKSHGLKMQIKLWRDILNCIERENPLNLGIRNILLIVTQV